MLNYGIVKHLQKSVLHKQRGNTFTGFFEMQGTADAGTDMTT